MNNQRFQWILNTIVVVIAATIAIQVYWNYKNYLTNKQQLINDIQVSLDNAVDTYYAKLAQHNTLAFAFETDSNKPNSSEKKVLDSIIQNIDSITQNISHHDPLRIKIFEDVSGFEKPITTFDSNLRKSWHPKSVFIRKSKNIQLDSLTEDSFKILTSKVIYSMASDTLQLEKIDTLFHAELQRKQLVLDYVLTFKTPFDSVQTINQSHLKEAFLTTTSKSTYLPRGSELKIHFTNITKTVLKRILLGILISTLLVLAVISSLFYLLKIIKHQKQISEVKNDFISNITHEFKTPIATIGIALESIKSFNAMADTEKTKNYIEMSNDQLQKLNTMVEKLLETATLDSDTHYLQKASTNITELVEHVISKQQLQSQIKTIHFKNKAQTCFATVDSFHFENAINNLIDNALKYGGNTITVTLNQTAIAFTISISDNGTALKKAHKDKIFEKFYRVPKGNTHDVKGYGIGLYYTKKIVEKHGGVIQLELDNHQTTFKIALPND